MREISRAIKIVSLVWLTAACTPVREVPTATLPSTPVVTPAFSGVPITVGNAERMTEFARINVEDPTPVVAIAFDAAVSKVAVAQQSATVRQLGLPDGHILAANVLTPVQSLSVGATSFDRTGRLLASAASDTPNARSVGFSTDLDGIRIWEAASGRLATAVTESGRSVDVALSPDGKWLIDAGRAGIVIRDASTGRATANTYYLVPDGGSYQGLDAVAFDNAGEYVALADRTGRVRIERVISGIPQFVDDIASPGWIGGAHYTDWHPTAVAFDPTRNWLALVANGKLYILNLQRLIRLGDSSKLTVILGGNDWREFEVSTPADPSAAMAFDPSGKLLAVGTKRGMQVWNLANQKKVVESTEAPVYAIAFSPDGRLLAYGDANGTVHVWGVPSK